MFKLMLAPMEDITSNAFRTVCFRHGADLTFTELLRVEALAKSVKETWQRLTFHDDTPTVIQLLGVKEASFKRFLSGFNPSNGFMGFNLNLGCPDPDAINLGAGCALVRRISKTKKLVQIFKDYGYKVSVKMRLGMNEYDKQNKVYLHLLNAVDAEYFIVHARHGKQSYNEPADFSVYESCVATGRKIIANGDIKTKKQIELLKEAGLVGAMIGRAAVIDPTIFNKLKGIESKGDVFSEYSLLADKYNEPLRYRKNFSKWFLK